MDALIIVSKRKNLKNKSTSCDQSDAGIQRRLVFSSFHLSVTSLGKSGALRLIGSSGRMDKKRDVSFFEKQKNLVNCCGIRGNEHSGMCCHRKIINYRVITVTPVEQQDRECLISYITHSTARRLRLCVCVWGEGGFGAFTRHPPVLHPPFK